MRFAAFLWPAGKYTFCLGSIAALLIILLGACSSPEPEDDQVIVARASATTRAPTRSPTPSPTATETHTLTPSPTSTSSPTPTASPTATAIPLIISGDPREVVLATPSPQNGAPCGVVDLLDFPLDPPHGGNARGGDDSFRARRYGKLHAGEDWGLTSRSNLGAPVYAIGHGQVTYAEPLGWRADKGTVIIRHVFADGSTILSFYGHLDPRSVVLNSGDCVQRGSQVGQIGRPRTPPHLHFEIRLHMPAQPGPGYWSVDPVSAGWKPPSRYIWNNRIAASPGVQWSRPFFAEPASVLGTLDDQTVLAIQDRDVIGIDVQDGSVLWRLPSAKSIGNAAVAAGQSTVYVADQNGRSEAMPLPDTASVSPTEKSTPAFSKKWDIELDMIGIPTLLPLADGGLVTSVWQWGVIDTSEGKKLSKSVKMFGLSADGEVLWEQRYPVSMSDWSYTDDDWVWEGDQLIVTSRVKDEGIWSIDESGSSAWDGQVGGRLARTDEALFLYDDQGVYRLNPETREADLLYPLPRSFPTLGDMIALPDGGLLVAHPELRDRRLIALDGEGNLQWQRSYADAGSGQSRLLSLAGRIYLVVSGDTTSTNEITIYAIQPEGEEMIHLFSGGTRSSVAGDAAAVALGDDRILIGSGGGSIAVLDVKLALDAYNDALNE